MSEPADIGDQALITDDVFLPDEKPEGYPAYHNYKRDREAARLKAIGWSLDEIAEELNLRDRATGDFDPRRAAAAVKRGLSLVHQVNIDEKRLEQLQHYELMKRHIWDSLNTEHLLVQQGKVIFHDGMPVEDKRFALEAFDRLNRIEESISKLTGTQAVQRFSVEADQLGTEISQLISMINTEGQDTTYTVERDTTRGEIE